MRNPGLRFTALLLIAATRLLATDSQAAARSTESAVILTPSAPPSPRINGARIFGVHPDHPFLFTVPATGERPMRFSASDLPKGLVLDPQTGRITGIIHH